MKLFRDMFDDLDAFGRFWLVLGLGSLAAAAAMSFDFGWGVSAKHAIFLAVLSVVAAFGPMAAEMLFTKGRKGPAIATALICVPLLGIEFYSHAGYTAGLRGTNIETANVQNIRFDGAQKDVERNANELSMLMAVQQKLVADAPWAATVKADGLRTQVATLEKAITEEGGKHNGGCKRRCLDLMKQKTDVESRIAMAEKVESNETRIKELQAAIDTKRDTANKTEHKSSAVDHQNKFLVKSVALFVNGSTTASDLQAMGADQSVSLAMALAGTGLPAFALFMAGLFRTHRRKDDPGASGFSPPVSEPFGNRTSEPNRAFPNLSTHTREIVREEKLRPGTMNWADLRAVLHGNQPSLAR